MGIVIELLLVFLAFCWVASKGMPWTLLFVPAYLVLLGLKFTPVGRKLRLSRTLLLCAAFFVAIAMTTGVLFFELLVSIGETAGDSTYFNFFFGPNLLKLLWAALIGASLAIEILAIVLIPYASLVARGKYGDYASYETNKGQATRAALKSILGISQGTWNVRDGKIEVSDKSDSILKRFGGPAILIVQLGHAVMLEQSGKISRIVKSGLTFLEPFERVSMVVSLATRGERVEVDHVATKDNVIIDRFECWVFHKVDPGPEEDQIRDDQFAYNETILRESVWSASGGDWRETVKNIASRVVRQVVGKYDLEDIVPFKDRKAFVAELQKGINDITSNALGVVVSALDIDKIALPAEAQKKLLDVKLAEWGVQVAKNQKQEGVLRGEVEAETLRAIENVRASAQNRMIRAITEAFDQNGNASQIESSLVVKLRYIEALEKMGDESMARMMLSYGLPLSNSDRLWFMPTDSDQGPQKTNGTP